jgi:hypothetical protein
MRSFVFSAVELPASSITATRLFGLSEVITDNSCAIFAGAASPGRNDVCLTFLGEFGYELLTGRGGP